MERKSLSSLEKRGFQAWKSCLYLLPVVKAAFAKLGRKESSFLKLEKFWSFQPGKKMSFQSGNSNFSTHMVTSLELHNHICGTSSSSPQPLFICTHWAFFVCFVTTVFLSFTYYGRLHLCSFMIPASLFYEVNDPLLQVCYKP